MLDECTAYNFYLILYFRFVGRVFARSCSVAAMVAARRFNFNNDNINKLTIPIVYQRTGTRSITDHAAL